MDAGRGKARAVMRNIGVNVRERGFESRQLQRTNFVDTGDFNRLPGSLEMRARTGHLGHLKNCLAAQSMHPPAHQRD